MNALRFAFFILAASAVYLGAHHYACSRISAIAGLAAAGTIRMRILFLCGALLFVAGEMVSRSSAAAHLRPLILAGGYWVGALSTAFAVLLARDAAMIVFKSSGFRIYSGKASLAAIAAVSVFAAVNAARAPRLREVRVPTEKLGRGESFTIAQISDLHLNFAVSERRVDDIISRVNALEPDIIVITGDLADAHMCDIGNFCRSLKRLKARHGVFAVTGNHEYYIGQERFDALARDTGIRTLKNENAAAGPAVIVGLNDDEGARFGASGPDFARAAAGADFSKFIMLLYHRPKNFARHAERGVDLQISGHTHAGQIPPADLAVYIIYKYPYGLYRAGKSCIYTTCGTGTWGPSMRLFSRSEIVKITVKGESK